MGIKDVFRPKEIPMTQVGTGGALIEDYSVRKNIETKQGSITRTPTSDYDIANKKYVDDQVGGVDTTINMSGQAVLSGTVVIMSGANIELSQTGQTITIGVAGVPQGSGTSTNTNTGDQTNITGNAATVTTNANLTGDVTSVGNGTTFGASKTISALTIHNAVIVSGAITGITDLVVADGGTGASTFTDGGVILGNGTGALAVTTAGTSGQYLVSQGASTDPVFQTIAAASSDMVLLATGTATAATSLTVNFTSTGYAKLAIYFDRFSTSGGDGITMTLNTIATGYVGRAIFNDGGTIGNRALGTTSIEVMNAPGSGTNESSGIIWVSDPDNSTAKTYNMQTQSAARNYTGGGTCTSQATISSVKFNAATGNLTADG